MGRRNTPSIVCNERSYTNIIRIQSIQVGVRPYLSWSIETTERIWLDEDQTESILTCVSDVRFKLQKANEFARENMMKAQCNMKTWYDKKTRTRSFKPGALKGHDFITFTQKSTKS